MASLPKPDPLSVPMTAQQLLAIRGTPEFEVEYRRQMQAIAEHDRKSGQSLAEEFFDWNVPGWIYDADL